jgi:ATP adenylyltransferase
VKQTPTITGTLPPPGVLHAPWRLQYLQQMDAAERQAAASGKPAGPSTGSFLRDYWLSPQTDVEHHVVLRTDDTWGGGQGTGGMILLNGFPYAGGHLLVALGEARPTLLDYDPAQRAALWRLVDLAAALMQRAIEPQGVNIGVNQGRAAGAGVPQHLHVHLVPRWGGDVNFLSVVGAIRVNPSSLEAMATTYRGALGAMRDEEVRPRP